MIDGNAIYPSLTDESTVRASNSVNIDQPQGRYQADMRSQTNMLKTIVPSSMTSLRSDTSNVSQDTKARLRLQDLRRFKNSEEVQKTLTHLSNLTPEQLVDLTTQHESGQKVAQKAETLINKLQARVDKALCIRTQILSQNAAMRLQKTCETQAFNPKSFNTTKQKLSNTGCNIKLNLPV